MEGLSRKWEPQLAAYIFTEQMQNGCLLNVRFMIEKSIIDPANVNGLNALDCCLELLDDSCCTPESQELYNNRLEIFEYLLDETDCVEKQQHSRKTLSVIVSLCRHNNERTVFLKWFRRMYNENSTAEVVDQILSSLYSLNCSHLKVAILEMFYVSHIFNPDYCDLVARLMEIDFKRFNFSFGYFTPTNSAYSVELQFLLCEPLNRSDVIKRIEITADYLKAIFQLFLHFPKIAIEYMEVASRFVTFYYCINSDRSFGHECVEYRNAKRCIHLDRFLDSMYSCGYKMDCLYENENVIASIYHRITSPRPFLCQMVDDSFAHLFEETDSVADLEGYAKFSRAVCCDWRAVGCIPTLFNLCRTTVRKAVFDASPYADSTRTQITKLESLELPLTVKERLLYRWKQN